MDFSKALGRYDRRDSSLYRTDPVAPRKKIPQPSPPHPQNPPKSLRGRVDLVRQGRARELAQNGKPKPPLKSLAGSAAVKVIMGKGGKKKEAAPELNVVAKKTEAPLVDEPRLDETKEESKVEKGAVRRQKTLFMSLLMRQIEPELRWTNLDDLKPHIDRIEKFLNGELQDLGTFKAHTRSY